MDAPSRRRLVPLRSPASPRSSSPTLTNASPHPVPSKRYSAWLVNRSLPVRFRPEARRNPGLAASCLMSIRYSVMYALQGRHQDLSLFDAAFDLTSHTCLSSENQHLPGTLRSPVQITFVTTMLDAGVDLRDVQIAAR